LKKDNSNSIRWDNYYNRRDPTVSYIIPTTGQEYTVQLLDDLACQSYKPAEVIVVDATPRVARNENAYENKSIHLNWRLFGSNQKGAVGHEMKLSQQK
jgi:hypothetical protein